MCIKKLSLLFFLLLTVSGFAQQKPLSIIFDTDIGPDYDDVGAISMVHAFADSGKINLLATIASSKYPGVASVLDVFNTYFKRPDLRIGVPKGDAVTDRDFQHWTDTVIARYPHSVRSNADVPDAVELYRKILVAQPDHSVTIITVGFLTNLGNLLESKADKYSNLPGSELVKRKVVRLYSMAGRFPAGKEYNVHRDVAASKKVFGHWPTEIVMSGFEIGEKIKTGLPLINSKNITNSPVKDVFRISIPQAEEDKNGRMSWDQTAVFAALIGVEPYFSTRQGRMIIDEDGSNTWDTNGKGHYYLIQKMDPKKVTEMIDRLMMHQP
jgi:pyrimidine-specific ribonucleoside hydrolase